MSLTKQDMQALSEMMEEKIGTAIGLSENRMMAYMGETRNEMVGLIGETRNEMMAYFENTVQKDIKQIADGHLLLAEKMDRMQADINTIKSDVDEIKATVTAHDIIITKNYKKAAI